MPEEYVRLLRDIEGGWAGLVNGSTNSGGIAIGNGTNPTEETQPQEPDTARTPTQTEHSNGFEPAKRDAAGPPKEGTTHYVPVVSTFSTSREDFEPWPRNLLGSQAQTPTSLSSEFPKRISADHKEIEVEDDDDDDSDESPNPKVTRAPQGLMLLGQTTR